MARMIALRDVLRVLSAVAAGCAAAAGAIAAEPLVLSDPTAPPISTPAGDGFLDRLMQQAFQRAGLELRRVRLPAERALREANAGRIDGDLNRIGGLEQVYPDLVRVAESNLVMEFSAFSRKNGVRLDGWKSLESHSVGHIAGWKIIERNLAGVRDRIEVRDADQLFALLARDRVEFVLYSKVLGLQHLHDARPRGVRLIEPALEREEMYVYLHRRHAALAPRLAEALRSLKADGSHARLWRETLAPLAAMAR